MKTVKRKLSNIERQLDMNGKYERYADCEFELEVAVEGIGGGTFVRYPDGRRERIEGDLFDELTKNDTCFDVMITD